MIDPQAWSQCPDNATRSCGRCIPSHLWNAHTDPHAAHVMNRPIVPPFGTERERAAESGLMSTYRDFTAAPIGSRRAPALRTVGTRERRSHLTAPRVPTVGIDIGGTKVMAGGGDAAGHT